MSDRDKFLAALEEAGSHGLHSHEARRRGLTGHPSERAAELERLGYAIRREKAFVGNRPGVRFVLEQTAGHRAGGRGEPETFATRAADATPSSVSGGSFEPTRLFTPPHLNPLRDSEAA